jgi:membrane dipeptidase
MSLHAQCVVIDGLIVSRWSRSVFEDMRAGGLSAANCTVSVWEGFKDTVANIAEMKRLVREHSDLLRLVRTTADIEAAKHSEKTGIILGFQNAQAFEDNLGTIEAFWDMGVRVVQLTYNTQNQIGTGCYERMGGRPWLR